MRIFKIPVLLLLLVILSCSPTRIYQDLPEVKAWETDISNFEKLDNSESYADNAVLFSGSSSIRLWKTLATDMAPFSVIQRGFGGSKLSDFTVYGDRIFSPHKCSALVMFVANDITGGNNDKSPEEVKKLFLYVLKTFRKTHPDTPFFWIGITPTSSRWKAWPEIEKANNLIREVCEKQRNTYYIKTDHAFLTEAGTPDDGLFIADKLHLNAKGYQIWTEIIKGELMKVLEK